jgi:hypothetical protein
MVGINGSNSCFGSDSMSRLLAMGTGSEEWRIKIFYGCKGWTRMTEMAYEKAAVEVPRLSGDYWC